MLGVLLLVVALVVPISNSLNVGPVRAEVYFIALYRCFISCAFWYVQSHHQYEWKQYEAFKRLRENSIPTGSVVELGLFSEWTTKVNGYTEYDFNDIHEMRGRAFRKSLDLMLSLPPLWNNTAMTAAKRRNDCSYWVSFHSILPLAAHNEYEFESIFTINQYDCLSKTSVLGGSSFEAYSRLGLWFPSKAKDYFQLDKSIITGCSIEDHFNSTYTMRCGFNLGHLANTGVAGTAAIQDRAMFCMNSSVVLQFEHFEAFSESRLPGIELILYRVPVSQLAAHTTEIVVDGVPHIYRVVQFPVDRLQSNVMCFEPLSGSGRRLRKRKLLEAKVVAVRSELVRNGQWLEEFGSVSNNVGELNASTSRVFDLSFEFSKRRADIAVQNPSDSFYCGNADATTEPRAYRDSLQQTTIPNHNIHELAALSSSPFRFDRRRLFSSWKQLWPIHGIGGLHSIKALMPSFVHSMTKHTRLYLVGESHMRYAWDYVVKLYFEGESMSKLGKKHIDVEDIREFVFKHRLFIPTVTDELVSIHKSTILQREQANNYSTTVAVQFGTWDLDVYPARNMMDSPTRGLPLFVRTVQELIVNRSIMCEKLAQGLSNEVMNELHVVIVDVFPHFHKPKATTVGGWRNNAVITAVNQKLWKMLVSMLETLASEHNAQSQHDTIAGLRQALRQTITSYLFASAKMKVTLVQANANVMNPIGEFSPGVCGDHSLCRTEFWDRPNMEEGRIVVFEAMQSGIVIMNAVLSAVYYANDEFSRSSSTSEIFSNYTEFDILRHPGPVESHYLILNGQRRLIPDDDTLQYLIRNRLEDCIQQTHIVGIVANRENVFNGIVDTCDKKFGYQAIKQASKGEMNHIVEGHPVYTMKSSVSLGNAASSSYSKCFASDFESDNGEYDVGMIVQNGRKHHVLLKATDRATVHPTSRCPEDEVAPTAPDCSPNPFMQDGSFIQSSEVKHFCIIQHGACEKLSLYYMEMLGVSAASNFTDIHVSDLKSIPKGPDYIFRVPGKELPDGTQLEADGRIYYMLNGSKYLVDKSLYSTIPGRFNGAVTKEYLDAIPGSEMLTMSMIRYPNGSLIMCSRTVYYVLNGQRRFIDGNTFEILGLSFSTLRRLSCSDMDKIPEGPALNVTDVRPGP
jgi:hypothetical protein